MLHSITIPILLIYRTNNERSWVEKPVDSGVQGKKISSVDTMKIPHLEKVKNEEMKSRVKNLRLWIKMKQTALVLMVKTIYSHLGPIIDNKGSISQEVL